MVNGLERLVKAVGRQAGRRGLDTLAKPAHYDKKGGLPYGAA
jgi:hypothetical protein